MRSTITLTARAREVEVEHLTLELGNVNITEDELLDSGKHLLNGLTDEQRSAVTTTESPLMIVAEAGSGKTRVLTRRIAWQVAQGNINPQQVLAVTFTRRAANELQSRLSKLRVRHKIKAGTFHAIALAQISSYNMSIGKAAPKIINNPSRFIMSMLTNCRQQYPTDITTITRIRNELSWAQANLISPKDYPENAQIKRRKPPFQNAAKFAEVYSMYTSAKAVKGVVDLDDVLQVCSRLMATEPEHASAQLWLNRHILVDEFQDVNPMQFQLLKAWLGETSTLTVVGDPNQAIYSWNGADPNLLHTLADQFPSHRTIRLRKNFRSTPEILSAASQILAQPAQPAFRAHGTAPTIKMITCGDAEPIAVAQMVRRRQPLARPWGMQAVLARTNAQLEPLKQALTQHGIPVATRRDDTLLKQPEITSLIAEWSPREPLTVCVADTRMAMCTYEQSHTYTTQNYLDAVQQSYRDDNYRDSTRQNNKDDTAQSYEFKWQRDAARAGRGALLLAQARVATFLKFADDYLILNPNATPISFIKDMELGDRSYASQDGVHILTFHSAKGLEWPIVHLVGLEDGYMPIAGAHTQQALAEEQRLFYVAATRALNELHMTWCNERNIKGKTVTRKPSPWLRTIHITEPPQPVRGEAAMQAVAKAMTALTQAASTSTT